MDKDYGGENYSAMRLRHSELDSVSIVTRFTIHPMSRYNPTLHYILFLYLFKEKYICAAKLLSCLGGTWV